MRYGSGDEVLRDVDLTLPSGSLHFLVGPSGAGKTSLLRLISLSHPPSRGTITLFGRDVSKLDRAGDGAGSGGGSASCSRTSGCSTT